MKKKYIKPDFETVIFDITDTVALLSDGGDIGPDDNIIEPWYL